MSLAASLPTVPLPNVDGERPPQDITDIYAKFQEAMSFANSNAYFDILRTMSTNLVYDMPEHLAKVK
jgi:hypothetical protein